LDGQAQTQPESKRAIELAWKAVARRERTVAELEALLERKGLAPAAIEAAVTELAAAGVLDDLRYARRFIEDKRSLERWGSERIAQDLRRRGVEASVVENALSRRERGAELEAAVELLSERLPGVPRDDPGRDRAWRLLVRRGYEPELAYEAVRAHGRHA
jgi:regulatory protein